MEAANSEQVKRKEKKAGSNGGMKRAFSELARVQDFFWRSGGGYSDEDGGTDGTLAVQSRSGASTNRLGSG